MEGMGPKEAVCMACVFCLWRLSSQEGKGDDNLDARADVSFQMSNCCLTSLYKHSLLWSASVANRSKRDG